ncbi:cyclodeaminase/cyclohydrolase family protein [Microbacterium sp. LRZ72]|uniref:cyclodeaminase/cyclohydrolase family protein n=1 Tax=Microbacterium sp. LRZ72 TaxID=2942481 RepID=UPI0029B51B9A|nr:cyclodeaminase/cyclohydrolase family protein [Microbacterium sp. LRZ72]MDX2376086.1 cyclodeaminase/cyclohydrolase family protein [Microbacterium sp. LRZ72]
MTNAEARTTDDDRIPASTALTDWLDELAQPKGSPGGGSASGAMLAISAALLHMVAAYTPDDERAAATGERLVGLRGDALAAAEEDGVRSAALGAALAEPKGAHREADVRDAARGAAESSAALGELGLALRAELDTVVDVGNRHLMSDVRVAAGALAAGLGGAVTNLEGGLDLLRAHRADGDGLGETIDRLIVRLAVYAAARDAVAAVGAPAS